MMAFPVRFFGVTNPVTNSPLVLSTDFEYLSNVPVLTIDVDEDFKGDGIKSADMIEKVGEVKGLNFQDPEAPAGRLKGPVGWF